MQSKCAAKHKVFILDYAQEQNGKLLRLEERGGEKSDKIFLGFSELLWLHDTVMDLALTPITHKFFRSR